MSDETNTPENPEISSNEPSPSEAAMQSDPEAAEGEADSRQLRLLEAILFSAPEPLSEEVLAQRMPDGADIEGLLATLAEHYQNHGINLVGAGGRWLFRTAEDLSEELRVYKQVTRRLSRAAMETLAIIAYHQPVTRAEIEEIRGVGLSRGTLDLLLESNWIAPKGRRRTAGRPVTWGTTDGFLVDFGIESIKDLPGLDDLKAAGLLDKRPAIQIAEIFGDGDGAADDEERPEGLQPESNDRGTGVEGEGSDAQSEGGDTADESASRGRQNE